MDRIHNLSSLYTRDQIEDIEKLLAICDKVPKEKREIYMITLRAYMEGMATGINGTNLYCLVEDKK